MINPKNVDFENWNNLTLSWVWNWLIFINSKCKSILSYISHRLTVKKKRGDKTEHHILLLIFFLHPFYFNILCDSDHCRFLVHYRPRCSPFDGCVELLYIEYIINQLIMGTWVRVMGMLFFDWSVVIDVQTSAFIWFTSNQRDIRIQALDRNYASTMYF